MRLQPRSTVVRSQRFDPPTPLVRLSVVPQGPATVFRRPFAVVVGFAQRLPVLTVPEQPCVAPVRDDVIDDRCDRNPTWPARPPTPSTHASPWYSPTPDPMSMSARCTWYVQHSRSSMSMVRFSVIKKRGVTGYRLFPIVSYGIALFSFPQKQIKGNSVTR